MKENVFYYVEISQEVFDKIQEACARMSEFLKGDLSAVKKMTLDAHCKRTDTELSDVEIGNSRVVEDCVSILELLGWNKPIEPSSTEGWEVFQDIADVLEYQRELLFDGSGSVPQHHKDDVPLMRVISAVKSTQNRKKQLRLVANEFLNRRTR